MCTVAGASSRRRTSRHLHHLARNRDSSRSSSGSSSSRGCHSELQVASCKLQVAHFTFKYFVTQNDVVVAFAVVDSSCNLDSLESVCLGLSLWRILGVFPNAFALCSPVACNACG